MGVSASGLSFDRENLPAFVLPEFEATISYEAAIESEFHKDIDTMEWWDKQDITARVNVFSGQDSYINAFEAFTVWLSDIKSNGADVAIWGNGSDFDNRLLTYSLSMYNMQGWDFRKNRDMRTIQAIFPNTQISMLKLAPEIKHTALGDARYEARVLNSIYQCNQILWDIL